MHSDGHSSCNVMSQVKTWCSIFSKKYDRAKKEAGILEACSSGVVLPAIDKNVAFAG